VFRPSAPWVLNRVEMLNINIQTSVLQVLNIISADFYSWDLHVICQF